MQIVAFGIDLRVLALQLAMLYTLLHFGKVKMSCQDIIAEDFGKARREELSKFIFKVQNNRGLVL